MCEKITKNIDFELKNITKQEKKDTDPTRYWINKERIVNVHPIEFKILLT